MNDIPVNSYDLPNISKNCASNDIDNDTHYQYVSNVTEHIRKHVASEEIKPIVGIICGTGLDTITQYIKNAHIIPYQAIKGMKYSKVVGHNNKIVYGDMNKHKVICFIGRCHFYEGYPMWIVTLPVRIMKLLGVRYLFVTNCCGGVNPSYGIGDIVTIRDHVNIPGMSGQHPLRGENDERWGTRFPHLFNAYDFELRKKVARVSKRLGLAYKEGVFCMNCGPTYQSKAEGRLLLRCGVDLVGMSTIPEVIVASHCGMQACAMSLVGSAIRYDEHEYEIIQEDDDDSFVNIERHEKNGSLIDTKINGVSLLHGEDDHNSMIEKNQDTTDQFYRNEQYKVMKTGMSINHEDVVLCGQVGGQNMGKIIYDVVQMLD